MQLALYCRVGIVSKILTWGSICWLLHFPKLHSTFEDLVDPVLMFIVFSHEFLYRHYRDASCFDARFLYSSWGWQVLYYWQYCSLLHSEGLLNSHSGCRPCHFTCFSCKIWTEIVHSLQHKWNDPLAHLEWQRMIELYPYMGILFHLFRRYSWE